MIDVYSTGSRDEAIQEIPVPFILAGTWHAEIRARLVDDDGDWYFQVGYNTGTADNRVGAFPAAWVRRPERTDLDGMVPPDVLEHIRSEEHR